MSSNLHQIRFKRAINLIDALVVRLNEERGAKLFYDNEPIKVTDMYFQDSFNNDGTTEFGIQSDNCMYSLCDSIESIPVREFEKSIRASLKILKEVSY